MALIILHSSLSEGSVIVQVLNALINLALGHCLWLLLLLLAAKVMINKRSKKTLVQKLRLNEICTKVV